jgi:uncharacterized damage-inducible protein DinB
MSYGIDHIRMMFGYDRWANGKLFDAASRLPREQLESRGGGSHDSVRGTLAHILYAHVTWYGRLAGAPPEAPDTTTMDGVRAGLAASYQRWSAYVDVLGQEGLEKTLAYRDGAGTQRDRPVSLVLAHLVNHGTYHRGEAGLMLTSLGASPGDLDLTYFYDEWRAAHEPG